MVAKGPASSSLLHWDDGFMHKMHTLALMETPVAISGPGTVRPTTEGEKESEASLFNSIHVDLLNSLKWKHKSKDRRYML